MGTVLIATVNREHGSTGVHTHTRALRDGLRAAGVACDVVTPFDGSRLWLPVFAVRPLVLNRLSPTWATLWYRHWHGAAVRANLRRRLARGDVSHVIAQCPVSAAAAMDEVARLEASVRTADHPGLRGTSDPASPDVQRLPRVTMVAHFNHSEAAEYRDQGVLAGDDQYRGMLAGEDDVLRRVGGVVYVSEWARDVVERARGVTPRAAAVVRNGIAGWDGTPVDRAALGLSSADVVLMSVGTLEPRKNQLALVELLATLPAACKLVLVGDGPDRAKLEARAAELNVAGRVVLLGHRRDVPALLPAADVYVHAATAENCPVAVIEAARAGLPWAASATAGLVELQRELGGVTLDQLPLLVADVDRRRRSAAAARAAFVGGFTREAMVRGYLDVLGGPGLRRTSDAGLAGVA